MGDDEFESFDPRQYWAFENNELVSTNSLGRNHMLQLNRLISFLEKERTPKEIASHMHIQISGLHSLLARLRMVRLVSLERKEEKHLITYRCADHRKDPT